MVKIISKISLYCVEHEDVIYYRWKENDWRMAVTTGYDDIVPITEDWQWLEDLFQEAKRKERLKCLDGLDVMSELNG